MLYSALYTARLVGASAFVLENLFSIKKRRFTKNPNTNRKISRFAKRLLLIHGVLRAVRMEFRVC